jgi:hypothetical protein
MHHGPIAGAHLEGLDPLVLLKSGNQNPLVVEHTSRGNLERSGHSQHQVGLAYRPAFREFERRWRVFGIALWRTGIGPFCERLNLGLAQVTVVLEMPDGCVGGPWRHLARQDGFLHRFGPWTRVFVCEQRHRRSFPGPVASLTAGL